jgi:REP element-mobilizing transposase RayT
MPRDNRIEFENSFHHIITRGYNQMNLFLEEEDFDYFLTQVSIVNFSHGIIIHSYCLMNNHVHLLIQNPLVNLADAMQLILTRYASYFKRKYAHRGKVFEKRYTSILIDTELYLMQLTKYIHNNPVGVIVDKPGDWAWSSYKYFVNPEFDQLSFLERDLILGKHKSLNALIEYSSKPDGWNPDEHIFSGTILGSEKFIEEITLKHVAPNIDTDLKGSFKLNKTYRIRIENIKSFISKINIDLQTQTGLLIYALREKTNLSYKEISEKFFLGNYSASAISGRYARIKSKAKTDDKLAKALIKIKSL